MKIMKKRHIKTTTIVAADNVRIITLVFTVDGMDDEGVTAVPGTY
jgi:hypothetical protein